MTKSPRRREHGRGAASQVRSLECAPSIPARPAGKSSARSLAMLQRRTNSVRVLAITRVLNGEAGVEDRLMGHDLRCERRWSNDFGEKSINLVNAGSGWAQTPTTAMQLFIGANPQKG